MLPVSAGFRHPHARKLSHIKVTLDVHANLTAHIETNVIVSLLKNKWWVQFLLLSAKMVDSPDKSFNVIHFLS